MKTLYESILDDEDILVNNTNDYITATTIYNKIIDKEQLTKTDIDWINNKVGVYKVNRNELEKLLFIIGNKEKKYRKLSLNWLNVSNVEDMSFMFMHSKFDGDISKWDVSGVKNMSWMFYDSQFNGDISKWDTGNVLTMAHMFRGSQFDGDISKWDVRRVENMSWMFYGSQFDGDISKWDVREVIDMRSMFNYSIFNGDISKWDVSNVKIMSKMFKHSKFDRDISKWKISSKCDTYNIFLECPIKDKYKPKNIKE